MNIQEEDPGTDDVHALLLEHLADMRIHSPLESIHALDIAALRMPAITFWTVRDEGVLQGCGALKQLDTELAEIKSMRTAPEHQRKGVANLLMHHILSVAAERELKYLLLETGTPDAYKPARLLYASHGFVECPPFADYKLDPYSVFMRRAMQV
ncbi:GNAT family N-acetyltransferase [Granulosicoccus antarcticus]|nr:GNAT family N-acetyltransferase [Granulosicoccus antarcticus]